MDRVVKSFDSIELEVVWLGKQYRKSGFKLTLFSYSATLRLSLLAFLLVR